ncbi:MAG: flagellar hook basal-body protein [Labilithrix sp.]|nr:flagellar hook basal-body protein [Labilithrix sp.]
MSKGVYVALSGAVAQQNALDTTALNVANASSTGYQRLRPVFRQALAGAVARDGGLRYAATSRTAIDTTPGATRVTERGLDVALPPGVYLAVTTPRGERYTRAGNLTLDKDGTLKTASGTPVAREDGAPIKVSGAGEVRIDPDGSVKVGDGVAGKLKLVKFERPDALEPEGSSLLAIGGAGAATAASEPLTVGALEESNAQPMVAMTELMTASRTFEAFQKVLDQFGEIDRKLLTTVPTAVE